MNSDIPKALTPIAGKPILQYLYESVIASAVDGTPIVVIGPERKRLCDVFGGVCEYVIQEEQLGTGHAVMMTKEAIGDADAIIVLYGDHPFVSPASIQALAKKHEERGNIITLMTTTVPSFDGFYQAFERWGRVLRGSNGHVSNIREYKDATEEERKVREVNPALFCFDTKWLWKNISSLQNQNAQQEYYLTDLIGLAVAQGEKLSSIDVFPEEVIGINTQEERSIAEEMLMKRR